MSAHVSAAEAARMYGLSDKTVRRWIRSGRLRADKRDGAYSVALADVSALAAGMSAHPSAQVSVHVSAPGRDTLDEDVRPPDEPGTDIMRAEAMAAYTRSLLEPLTAALERSQGRVAELERDTGRLAAELERATSAVVALGDELQASELSRRRDRRLLVLALAVLAALLPVAVAGGVLIVVVGRQIAVQ